MFAMRKLVQCHYVPDAELRLDNSGLHAQHLATLGPALRACTGLRRVNLAQNALGMSRRDGRVITARLPAA
jgi:hypothetical protein